MYDLLLPPGLKKVKVLSRILLVTRYFHLKPELNFGVMQNEKGSPIPGVLPRTPH